MRSFSLVLSGIVSVAVCSFSAAADSKRGVLEVKDKLYDFGTVNQGQRVAYDFELLNKGNADLAIQRLAPTCGCTAVSTTSSIIPAGSASKIHVEFDTSGFSGQKTKTVEVFTNDIDTPQLTLALKGVILPGAVIEPQRVDFGELVISGDEPSRQRKFEITLPENTELKIADVKAFAKYLRVEQLGTSGRTSAYRVTVDSTAPRGSLRERVAVTLQGPSKSTSVNVPVIGFVRGDVRLSPATLSFGILEGSQPLERTAKLENLGSSPLRILSAGSSSTAVETEVKQIVDGKSYSIRVKVYPERVSSDLRTAVDIETDKEGEENVAINVFGVLPPR